MWHSDILSTNPQNLWWFPAALCRRIPSERNMFLYKKCFTRSYALVLLCRDSPVVSVVVATIKEESFDFFSFIVRSVSLKSHQDGFFVLKFAKSNLFAPAKQKYRFNLTSSHFLRVVFLSVSLKDVCRSQDKTGAKTKIFSNAPNQKRWKGLLQSAILQRRQRLLKDRSSDSLRLKKIRYYWEGPHDITRFCFFVSSLGLS